MAQAKANLAESESLAGEVGGQWPPFWFLFASARLAGMMGDVEKARVQYRQSADAARKMGNLRIVYSCNSEIAHLLRKHGKIDEALEIYLQVLPRWKELGHRAAVAHELECIAFILIQKSQPERAVTLLGAAEALRQLIDSTMTPPERTDYERVVSELRANVNENTFKQLWDAGRAMNMDQAVEYALKESNEQSETS